MKHKPSTKIISMILTGVVLCANAGYPTDALRVPIGVAAERAHKVVSKEDIKQELASIIAGVIEQPADGVREELDKLTRLTLHQIWVNRSNLKSDFFKAIFISKWGEEHKDNAFGFLAKGYFTEGHQLDRYWGQLKLDSESVNEFPEAFRIEIPESLLGRQIYGSPKHNGGSAKIEWAYFPDLSSWLPVQVIPFKEGSNETRAITIKTAVKGQGMGPKEIIDIGANFKPGRLSQLFGKNKEIYSIYMRVPTEGVITFGNRYVPGERSHALAYKVQKWEDQLVRVAVGKNGVPLELQLVGTDKKIKLRIIEIRAGSNKAKQPIESHITLNSSTIEHLVKRFKSFWVTEARLGEGAVLTAGRTEKYKMGAREFSGVLTVNKPWICEALEVDLAKEPPSYTMRVEYSFRAPQGGDKSMLIIKGAPAYLQVETDRRAVLKQLQARTKDGLLKETVDGSEEVTRVSLLKALAYAAQEGCNIVATRLDPILSGGDSGGWNIGVAGHRIYVSADMLKLFRGFFEGIKFYAEAVYDPSKVEDDEEGKPMPVPVEIRLGFYSDQTEDPHKLQDSEFTRVASFRLIRGKQHPQRFIPGPLSAEERDAVIASAKILAAIEGAKAAKTTKPELSTCETVAISTGLNIEDVRRAVENNLNLKDYFKEFTKEEQEIYKTIKSRLEDSAPVRTITMWDIAEDLQKSHLFVGKAINANHRLLAFFNASHLTKLEAKILLAIKSHPREKWDKTSLVKLSGIKPKYFNTLLRDNNFSPRVEAAINGAMKTRTLDALKSERRKRPVKIVEAIKKAIIARKAETPVVRLLTSDITHDLGMQDPSYVHKVIRRDKLLRQFYRRSSLTKTEAKLLEIIRKNPGRKWGNKELCIEARVDYSNFMAMLHKKRGEDFNPRARKAIEPVLMGSKEAVRGPAKTAVDTVFNNVFAAHKPPTFDNFDAAYNWILILKHAYPETSKYTASKIMRKLGRDGYIIDKSKINYWAFQASAADYALRQETAITNGIRTAWDGLSMPEKKRVARRPSLIGPHIENNIFIKLSDLNNDPSKQRHIESHYHSYVMKYVMKFYSNGLIRQLAESLPQEAPVIDRKKNERLAELNTNLEEALKRLIDRRNPRPAITGATLAEEAGMDFVTYWRHRDEAKDIDPDILEGLKEHRRHAVEAKVLTAIDSLIEEGILKQGMEATKIAAELARKSGVRPKTIIYYMSKNSEVQKLLLSLGLYPHVIQKPRVEQGIEPQEGVPAEVVEPVDAFGMLPDDVTITAEGLTVRLIKQEHGFPESDVENYEMIISHVVMRGGVYERIGPPIEATLGVTHNQELCFGVSFNTRSARDAHFVTLGMKALLLNTHIKRWLYDPVDMADKDIIKKFESDNRFKVNIVKKGSEHNPIEFYEISVKATMLQIKHSVADSGL